MSSLKASSLFFKYTEQSPFILSNVNFEVGPGEFLSIVGPSGSGKTTLLKLLAGLMNPSSGTVSYDDEELEGPDVRLVPGYEEIKLVHQQFELRPNISARENVAAVLNGYTAEYRKERVKFLLDFFSLSYFENHKPAQLSGGQQQRLAIAKAMANEPGILLMDEPFSSLDPMNSAVFLKEVKRLAKETNTGVVLVTHDTRDAMMADKIVVLMNGMIKQSGSPDEIYYRPNGIEVGSFFGPINRLKSKEMKLFGVETLADSFLRAESFLPSLASDKNGFQVKEVIFRGAYQVLIVMLSKQKEVLVFDFGKLFKIGDFISLELKQNEVITF